MRGARSDVHCHVECFTLNDATQLSLRMWPLIVQSAESALLRTGMIILNKGIADAQRSEAVPVIGFKKKTARITKNLRAKFQHARETCFDPLHRVHAAVRAIVRLTETRYSRRLYQNT